MYLIVICGCAVGGIGFGLDAQATAVLKKFFHRARPSTELHSSYSFPSGHSTSVYFIAGFLFFIVVPALYEALREEAQKHSPEGPAPGTLQSHVIDALGNASRPINAALLTLSLGTVTQSGRILADVHWTSDVLAGMMWGSTGVALALIVQGLVYKLAGVPPTTILAAKSNGGGQSSTNGAVSNGAGRKDD